VLTGLIVAKTNDELLVDIGGKSEGIVTSRELSPGMSVADLKVGDQVHVKGAANGTAIDAREVNVQNNGPDDNDRGEAEGVVGGLAGTCPAITFTVGAAKTKVTANDKTVFGAGGCAAVVNGANVQVHGAVQTDGSILASRVSAAHAGDDDGD